MSPSQGIALLLALFLPPFYGAGAAPDPTGDGFLPGYSATGSGATIAYASPIAAARNALICRATDGLSKIQWQTAPVPAAYSNQPVTFVWLAGLGCNLGTNSFTLHVNGKDSVRFTTASHEAWDVAGSGGVRLAFRTVMVDRNQDRFGFMNLTLPPGTCEPGKPVEVRITGDAAKSSAWVMTFTYMLANGMTAATRPVLLRDRGTVTQPLDLEIINAGKPTTAEIHCPGIPETRLDVPFGVTRHSVKVTPVTKPTTVTVALEMEGTRTTSSVTINPVRPWTVYLVQHTHTDIGYTRPQTEILAEHLRYIDYALDYCDQTDGYPDDAKFRWTCETSWAVREYLRTRPPQQIARLTRRVKEGRIELTGMLLNWAEVADENALVHSLEPIRLMREMQLPVVTAMQDDVNGFAWCLVDYFSKIGIRYVTSGINAARALKPFAVPTPFWWESPSGNRVLAYRADHYMTGNFQNIHTQAFELIEQELPAYLQQLETGGYPYDRVSVQYSGYFTDNSPPSTFACENIRRWNETYEVPKLRSATVREFLGWVETHHATALPTYRVAWPDWWTDGYGCAMRETAAGRQTQTDLIVNQGVLAMAGMQGAVLPPTVLQQVQTVADHLHFYNEHTFGAAESISDPLAENSQIQWAEKSSYAWQAVMQSRMLREGAMGLLQPYLPSTNEPGIVVFNTLSWVRSGLHTLYIDNQILPKDRSFSILDSDGQTIPAQLVRSRPEGNYWALYVRDVPPLGWKTFRVVPGRSERTPDPPGEVTDTLENDHYRIVLDQQRGTIASLFDKELRRDLLDHTTYRKLGEFLYERLSDRRPLEELQPAHSSLTGLSGIRVDPGIDGPLWRSIVISGTSAGFAEGKRITCEIRLFKTCKRIDLHFRGHKIAVNEPEAVYVAFPFQLPEGKIAFEAQGGIVEPGVNQLPGTATDWNTVQNFAAVRNAGGQILLVSDEVPLMQFGGINTGRYKSGARPESQQIYSWVLNNYWTTNFRSSQEGELVWSYAITSGPNAGDDFATQFGWGLRVPFVSRVLPGAQEPADGATQQTFWPFAASSVILIAARPAREGMILHLRETAGKPVELRFHGKGREWHVEEVDALGSPVETEGALRFRANGVKFLRVWR